MAPPPKWAIGALVLALGGVYLWGDYRADQRADVRSSVSEGAIELKELEPRCREDVLDALIDCNYQSRQYD